MVAMSLVSEHINTGTGMSDVLCHYIKPDQHKNLSKYSLGLNYEAFKFLSLIAGL
jgi:hypothetical protein